MAPSLKDQNRFPPEPQMLGSTKIMIAIRAFGTNGTLPPAHVLWAVQSRVVHPEIVLGSCTRILESVVGCPSTCCRTARFDRPMYDLLGVRLAGTLQSISSRIGGQSEHAAASTPAGMISPAASPSRQRDRLQPRFRNSILTSGIVDFERRHLSQSSR